MAKKILVGLDGTEGGDRALDAAVDHARAAGSELVLSYVIPWSPFTFSTPEENATRHKRREEELEVAESKILQPRRERLATESLKVTSLARHGHPAKTLVQLADELGVSMIVVGRVGDSPLKTRLFGGTAAALVQMAPCPVLVVP